MSYDVVFYETRKYVVRVNENNHFKARDKAIACLSQEKEKYFVGLLEDNNIQVYEVESTHPLPISLL